MGHKKIFHVFLPCKKTWKFNSRLKWGIDSLARGTMPHYNVFLPPLSIKTHLLQFVTCQNFSFLLATNMLKSFYHYNKEVLSRYTNEFYLNNNILSNKSNPYRNKSVHFPKEILFVPVTPIDTNGIEVLTKILSTFPRSNASLQKN